MLLKPDLCMYQRRVKLGPPPPLQEGWGTIMTRIGGLVALFMVVVSDAV